MKYLILGAGVAGLTFATALKKFRGEDSFLLLERNAVGGIVSHGLRGRHAD